MRYLRTQVLNRRAPYDQRLQIDLSNSVIMSTPAALQLPAGDTSQQPIVSQRYGSNTTGDLSGMIRYNTQTEEFEGYQAGTWRAFRFKESGKITLANYGAGDYVEDTFGPLSPQPPSTVSVDGGVSNTWGGQNIIVIVENVIQILGINYNITQAPTNGKSGTGYWITFTSPVPLGKIVYALHGFDQ